MQQAELKPSSNVEASPEKVFWEGAATYLIPKESTPRDLFDDSQMLLEFARETIGLVAEELANEGSQLAANLSTASTILFGVLRTLDMAASTASAARCRVA